MKIRRIKPEHVTNCPWCKARGYKERAIWHLTGANKQACDAHLGELRKLQQADRMNEDYSEADHQTWLKL